MCLGIPAQVVSAAGDCDLIRVEMAGSARSVNAGLLDERPSAGDWVLVHLGFALSTMTAQEAAEAMATLEQLSAERTGTAPEGLPW